VSGPVSRDLEFDLSSTDGLDLALDIAADDKLASRISRPDIELPEIPGSDVGRSRQSSGSHAAVGRTISGSHPIVDADPASIPAVGSARSISGTGFAAIGSRGRLSSGPHPVAEADAAGSAAPAPREAQRAPEKPLVRRLVPGIVLVVLSVLITIADQAYAASTGEVFSLGPVRTTWIAALCMVAGVAIIVRRLIQQQKA
jgi:hypothetical protein